jgi:hypothetical protein
VQTPILVLHRRQIDQLGVHVARGLAARIPNARLALLEGQSVYEAFGETEPIATALDEFLSEGPDEKRRQEAKPTGEFRTLLLRTWKTPPLSPSGWEMPLPATSFVNTSA